MILNCIKTPFLISCPTTDFFLFYFLKLNIFLCGQENSLVEFSFSNVQRHAREQKVSGWGNYVVK